MVSTVHADSASRNATIAVNGFAAALLRQYFNEMLTKIARRITRPFIIKTKFEGFAIIYALALGAADRGIIYMAQYPGWMGQFLALGCATAVMMAGGKIIDAIDLRAELGYQD